MPLLVHLLLGNLLAGPEPLPLPLLRLVDYHLKVKNLLICIRIMYALREHVKEKTYILSWTFR